MTPSHPVLVVMGVSGCGKSTVGQLLARRLGWVFLEGDEFHPAANVERMAAGIPLTDEDRAGWLQALADRMRLDPGAGQGLVVSCSALRRSYRDVLRSASTGLRFVHLQGQYALLSQRMAARPGHYMPPSLLDSQYETLEAPADDEGALTFDVHQAPEAIADGVLRALSLSSLSGIS